MLLNEYENSYMFLFGTAKKNTVSTIKHEEMIKRFITLYNILHRIDKILNSEKMNRGGSDMMKK